VVSFAFGALGTVLLLVGLVAANNPLLLSGAAAGVLSLLAALYWRSQLVAAWRARKRGQAQP
jgi:hypothetical protein